MDLTVFNRLLVVFVV